MRGALQPPLPITLGSRGGPMGGRVAEERGLAGRAAGGAGRGVRASPGSLRSVAAGAVAAVPGQGREGETLAGPGSRWTGIASR